MSSSRRRGRGRKGELEVRSFEFEIRALNRPRVERCVSDLRQTESLVRGKDAAHPLTPGGLKP